MLASAGCIGSSSAGSRSGPSSDRDVAVPWSKTVLTVTYGAPHCPAGARCYGHVKSPIGQFKLVRVVRDLRCDPAGGDYTDPSEACAALRKIVQTLATKTFLCACVSNPPHAGAKAVGFYNGKRRTIPLDGCSLCNLHLGADVAVLLPGGER
jgi:hypothetical protein